MNNDLSHAAFDPCQAPDTASGATGASSEGTAATGAVQRACALCSRSLQGRRPETLTCSSRCRSALARQRRRDDLIARVRRAETALREAAAALASLRELAGLDATLELGALLKRGAA
jgi:hypothetical protein